MSHKYKIRQMVRLMRAPMLDSRASGGGIYEVMRLMPADETGEVSYRVRSVTTERAVRESEIRAWVVPDKGFGDRLSTATSARKAMQQRFQAKAGADDSAFAERKAARHAISVAREVRLAERETAKAAEAVREAEERAHDAAEQEAREITERGLQLEREAREAVETAERQVALEVEQKAARDARYAARKARKWQERLESAAIFKEAAGAWRHRADRQCTGHSDR